MIASLVKPFAIVTVLLCFGITSWFLRFRLDYFLFGVLLCFWDQPLVFELLLLQDTVCIFETLFDGEKIKLSFDIILCIWVLNSPLGKSQRSTNPATRVRFQTPVP